jgi:hypothetical protein
VLRHDAEMVDGIDVECHIAHRAIGQLKQIGVHESIAQHVPPAPGDVGSGIGILLGGKM